MNIALKMIAVLLVVGCARVNAPVKPNAPLPSVQSGPSSDQNYVRAKVEFDVTSASQQQSKVELVKRSYAAGVCAHGNCTDYTDITVTNATNTTFALTQSGMAYSNTQTNSNIGNIVTLTVGTLFDNNLFACGGLKCTSTSLNIYTTNSNGTELGSGLYNPVNGQSIPLLFTSPLNLTPTAIPFLQANGLALNTIAIPAVQQVVSLANGDFTSDSYALTTDFTKAGAGTYQAHIVVEYVLSAPSIPMDLVTISLAGTGTGVVTGTPSTGTGSINCPPLSSCAVSFLDAENFTLTATPDYGNSFTGFTGDLTSATSPSSFFLNNNKNITASFLSGFNKTKGLKGTVQALAFDSSGNLYVGGALTSYNNLPLGNLARFTASGAFDTAYNTTIGSGFNNTVDALAVDSSGNVYVGGLFTSFNGAANNANFLAKLSSAGSLLKINPTDSPGSQSNGFDSSVLTLTIDPSGNIYAGGWFLTSYVGGSGSTNNANCIAKITSAGVISKINPADTVSATGNGFNNVVSSIILDTSRNLYVGGAFTESSVGNSGSTGNANYFAKISSSGVFTKINSNDSPGSTGNGFNSYVYVLALDSSGNIYAGGTFNESFVGGSGNPNNANSIAKLTSAGVFTKINPSDSNSSTGNGFNTSILALATDSSGNVYVGGNQNTAYVGGVVSTNNSNYITKISSAGVLTKFSSSDVASITGNGFNAAVNSLVLDSNSDVYAGGSFTESYVADTAQSQGGLAKITPAAGLDPTFNRSGSGFNGTILALTSDSSGDIYYGGQFTSYNGVNLGYIAKTDQHGNLITSFNPSGVGFNGQISSLVLDSSGNIYVGGSFTSYNGGTNNANYIAKLDSNGNLLSISPADLSTATGNGFNSGVSKIAVDSSNNIYMVGNFTRSYIGGAANANNANYIAKVSSTGVLTKINSSDVFSATGNGFNNPAYSVVIDSGGNLYIGGSFVTSYIGGAGTTNNANRIAKISSSGVYTKINASDVSSTTGNGFSGNVIGMVIDPSGNLYINGQFFTCYIGGSGLTNNANSIAKINSSGVLTKINPSDTASTTGNGLGATGSPVYNSIVSDSSGNIYFAGIYNEIYIGGSGTPNNANNLAKINSSGVLTKINTNDTNTATGNGLSTGYSHALTIDINGNLYIGGIFTSSNIGGVSVLVDNIIKLNSAGALAQ